MVLGTKEWRNELVSSLVSRLSPCTMTTNVQGESLGMRLVGEWNKYIAIMTTGVGYKNEWEYNCVQFYM